MNQMIKHTPGPWKAILNAVAGPNGSAVANARLIAAAPDLLEVCKAYLDWDDCSEEFPGGECCWCTAQKAIAKAEGKDESFKEEEK